MESISRLAALKQKLAEQNQIRSKPFPLESLLLLYEKSNAQDTYIGYMEGFKLLVGWLSPIDIPDGFVPIPKLCNSYEMQQIAAILGVPPGVVNFTYSRMYFQKPKETKSCQTQQIPDSNNYPIHPASPYMPVRENINYTG